MKDLANAILPSLTTDLTDAQIFSLLFQMFPVFRSMELSSYRIPADQTYYSAMIRGMYVLVPDLPKIRSLLQEEYLPLHASGRKEALH